MTIYRGKGGKFASKEEIAAIKAHEAQMKGLFPKPEAAAQPAPEEAPVFAYKGFNNYPLGTYMCRAHEFKVGEENVIKGPIRICANGFHASPTLLSVLTFYSLCRENVFGKVKIAGDMQGDYGFTKKDFVRTPYKTDKICAEKLTLTEIMHPCHILNTIVQEVEAILSHKDKYHHAAYSQAKNYWRINEDSRTLSGSVKYLVQTPSRGIPFRDIIMPVFGQYDPVIMTSVPGANVMTEAVVTYLCADRQSSTMRVGGTTIVAGNSCKIIANGGFVDVMGNSNTVLAMNNTRVRFHKPNGRNVVTFIDKEHKQVRKMTDTDPDATIGKWVGFNSTSKVVYESTFSAE